MRLCAILLGVTLPALGQYDPPAGYYSAATGTGSTLKSQLHGIIAKDWFNASSTSHRVVTYGNLPEAFVFTDRDPNNSNNVILVYTGASVSNVWDTVNLPWNREHTWPDSLGPNGSGPDYSDLHHMRPCNTQVNSNRGNLPFGIGTGYWDPNQGSPDRGDMARAMFYMDVRYDGTETATTNLTVVNGLPGANQMGDLARMLQWHYQDPPSAIEKRRNQLVFDKTLNPSYYQGNRNPFIDHPEYVWTIFGGGSNNSRLYVGGTSFSDGSSSLSISLGRVMKNGTIGTASVTLNKAGSHPTTYDISVAGSATTSAASIGNTFDYNAQSRSISLGLSASTSTTGLKTGTITIDNTDLSTGGTGLGSADGNDTIGISAAVVDNRIVTASPVDFGRVIGNKIYTRTSKLTTSGGDSNFTRVTVGGGSISAGEITVEPALARLFDDPTDSTTRTLMARFRSSGLKGGVIPLTVTGEGLAGESVQPVSIAWSALVMDGVNESTLPLTDAQLGLDFGSIPLDSQKTLSFPIGAWLASAGLRLDNAAITQLSQQIDAFDLSLTNDTALELIAGMDTTAAGAFEQDLTLSLDGYHTLSLHLAGSVVPEPGLLALLPVLLLRRSRRVR